MGCFEGCRSVVHRHALRARRQADPRCVSFKDESDEQGEARIVADGISHEAGNDCEVRVDHAKEGNHLDKAVSKSPYRQPLHREATPGGSKGFDPRQREKGNRTGKDAGALGSHPSGLAGPGPISEAHLRIPGGVMARPV